MGNSKMYKGEREGKMFDNPIMDKLSTTHIAVPLIIFYGMGLALLFVSIYYGIVSPKASFILFASGFIFFTLFEYVIHRSTFHMGTETPKKKKIQHLIHGVHHDFPKDKRRLAMPPLASISITAVFFLIYRLIMGDLGLPFTGGFVAGYAFYLCIHYSVHAFRPPNNFLKALWIHHSIHHYQQPNAAYGVSSAFWDRVFRTMPDKGSLKKVDTGKFIDEQEGPPL